MRISSPLIGELHIGNRSPTEVVEDILTQSETEKWPWIRGWFAFQLFLSNTIPVQRIKAARQEDASQTTAEPIIVSYRLSKSYKDFENVQGRENFAHLFSYLS